jgi:hypothetical protein
MTKAEAEQKKEGMISLVRDSGLLRGEASDEEIWAHWRELSKAGPASAFDAIRSLNIFSACSGLAAAGVPDSVLAPIREYAMTPSSKCCGVCALAINRPAVCRKPRCPR